MNRFASLISLCIIHAYSCTEIAYAQNQYVNLQPLTNPAVKAGWNLVFQDDFTGSKNPMWKNGYCWGNAHPGSPFYNRDANYIQTSSTLKLITKKEDYTATGNYVQKHYTSSMINSDPCTLDTLPQTGRTWKYGYFEIRCKNPKGQLMWPAFWLFGEPNSKSKWNELDVFEFGTGDGLVMTNHFQTSPSYSTHQAISKWVYAIPGQTFGDTWVTYGLKWEPNKLVWYINNIPVRVETDQTSIIPNVAMRLKVGSGHNDLYTPYDLNLLPNFPNEMEIDYVRVYQRSNHSTPNPVFTINKQQSYIPSSPINIPFVNSLPIYLDGSESYMPNHSYFLSIQKSDIYGNLTGSEAMGWLTSSDVANINKFNITAFAQSKGLTLTTGNYYRVKLDGGSPWTETNQYIYLTTCTSNISFKINGQNNTNWPTAITIPYNNGKSRIILDGTATTTCNNSYFISLQECYSNGVGFGTEISKWLSTSESNFISYYDVENFAQQNSFTIGYGKYYRVKLATGPSWTDKIQVIYTSPCSNIISFTLNNQSNTFPAPINIDNGKEIILDGSASKFCDNFYFVSIQECNSNGNGFGTEITEWKQHVSYDSQNNIYYYSVGRYDIRDLCKRKNFDLGCNKYYRIKLAANNPWTESVKIIYITPCLNVDNTYQINGVDATTYNYGDPNTMSINLYAPQSISCNETYFVSVQKRLNGVLTGTEAMGWLTLEEIYNLKILGIFDLKAFAQSKGLTLANNTTYRVKLVAGAGTCNPSTWLENNKIIYFGTGSGKMATTDIEENIESELEMKIYPNPTNDKFLVSLPYSENKITLNLINVQGKTLKSIETNEGLEVINVADFPSGIYIMQAIITDKIITKKVQILK